MRFLAFSQGRCTFPAGDAVSTNDQGIGHAQKLYFVKSMEQTGFEIILQNLRTSLVGTYYDQIIFGTRR